MKSKTQSLTWLVLAVATCLVFAVSMSAQVQSTTSTTTGQVTKEVQVQRAEVVYVEGNDLVLKMEDGTIRHFPNVPESARATVNGKEIGIHDVKVGMKLEKTITTTTIPSVVTTVQSVTGKVWQIHPPNTVILTMDNGQNQQFNIPKDQKFNVDGQMVDAWGLKKGMKVSATKIVETPITSVSQVAKLTGTNPPPPPPPDVPILIVVLHKPAPTEVAQAAAPAELPKTGSFLPLFGMLGMLSLGSGFVLRMFRSK